MHKLLVVDDETWIRRGIIAKLANMGFLFAWIGEAENGEQAIDMIIKEQPQIVITDVKMPILDGIMMIRHIRELGLPVKFIIISGYAEFEYAEQALNMGVSGYILKPVSEETLHETLHIVLKELDNEQKTQTFAEDNRILTQNNETLMVERAVNRIFHSIEKLLPDNARTLLQPCGSDTTHHYMLALVHIDHASFSSSSFKYQDLELLKFAIKNIISERLVDQPAQMMDNLKDITQIMILFANTDDQQLNRNCNLLIYDIYNKISRFVGATVTIAVSGIVSDITVELYNQAKTAFDMRLINGSNKVYHYEATGLSEKIFLPEHKLRLLQRYIETRKFSNVNVLLEDIFSAENLKGISRNTIRGLYFEIIRIILRINSSDEDLAGTLNAEMAFGEMLDHFDNPAQIVRYLYTTIVESCQGDEEISASCKEIVSKTREFIQRNYISDISVKDLASRFAVNPNYLSTIFKQETGSTLMKYLTDVRMEKACQLLSDTQGTINEVARIVGYEDVQYFYRVFKKSIGQTPLEYRTKV